jgi:murein DD-endopeptidase MepM/ murein hydrolase activator NlpD
LDSTISQESNSSPAYGGEASSEGGLSKQISQDLPRRSYGSAAMIGVALSMGACGLLVPQKGDAALAADKADVESLASEPNATPLSDPLPPVAQGDRAQRTALASAQVHTVQEGENLSNIARTYGITAQQVAQLNQLSVSAVLHVGQSIALPTADVKTDAVPVLAMAPTSRSMPDASKVRQDDAIVKLKEQQSRLKKSLAELRSEENPIIAAVPTSQSRPEATASFSTHQVEVGETLSTIARAHGVSPREIATLNRISDPNSLFANQVIKVPQVKSSQVTLPIAKPAVPVLALNAPVKKSISLPETVQSTVQSTFVPTVPSIRKVDGTAERSVSDRNYVDKLMVEVKNLRQKYQTSQVAYAPSNYGSSYGSSVVVPTVSMPASIPPKSDRRVVNPEFQKRLEAAPDKSIRSATQTRIDRVIQAPALPQPKLPVVSAAAPVLMARASVGGNANYATPLVQTTALRMAAPQMPSIGASDSYLPQGKGAMKGYVWPAQGVFTSGYGWRWGRMHRGIDVAAPVGTPIVAAAPGVVSYSGWNDGGYGYLVEIDHADGTMTRYAHNHRLLVSNGQQVNQGQQIAEMGSTGFSTGPHLHFEIHKPEGVVNPVAYLPNDRG